jgi:hypothetical protein
MVKEGAKVIESGQIPHCYIQFAMIKFQAERPKDGSGGRCKVAPLKMETA